MPDTVSASDSNLDSKLDGCIVPYRNYFRSTDSDSDFDLDQDARSLLYPFLEWMVLGSVSESMSGNVKVIAALIRRFCCIPDSNRFITYLARVGVPWSLRPHLKRPQISLITSELSLRASNEYGTSVVIETGYCCRVQVVSNNVVVYLFPYLGPAAALITSGIPYYPCSMFQPCSYGASAETSTCSHIASMSTFC